jgi:diadenosine tetraphosphate (Ap4A) HIT family hydrolase
MCELSGGELGPFGIRVYEGRWSDAYLARHPVRPGYAYVIWKGRHVTEPTDLSAEEAAGFWCEVARVARAVEEQYRPVKMNWLHLGNGVPHLHVHLVPRPRDDSSAGGPLEAAAFDQAATPALSDEELRAGGDALRALLR